MGTQRMKQNLLFGFCFVTLAFGIVRAEKTVTVVGSTECVDCVEKNIKAEQAFKGTYSKFLMHKLSTPVQATSSSLQTPTTPPVPEYKPPATPYQPPVPVYNPPQPGYQTPAPVYMPTPTPVPVYKPTPPVPVDQPKPTPKPGKKHPPKPPKPPKAAKPPKATPEPVHPWFHHHPKFGFPPIYKKPHPWTKYFQKKPFSPPADTKN